MLDAYRKMLDASYYFCSFARKERLESRRGCESRPSARHKYGEDERGGDEGEEREGGEWNRSLLSIFSFSDSTCAGD